MRNVKGSKFFYIASGVVYRGNSRVRTIIFSILVLLCASAHSEIYKWTDEEGKVHFADKKPESAKVERVHLRINSFTQVTYQLAPVTAEVTKPKGAKNIVMYSTTWCTEQ